MADMMAVISKAVFEKSSPDAALGSVLPLDRYTSNNKALQALGDAGSRLFLFTVRPPDEQLWLVGVLGGLKFDGTAWVGAANKTPITDLGPIKSKITFVSGTGIKAKPGALGMSLQTPRALTAEDVALILGAKPAKAEKKAKGAHKAAKEPKLIRIRGGTFWMGFTIDDIHAVLSCFEGPEDLSSTFARSRPIRAVTVRPFFVSPTQATGEDEEVSAKVALATVKAAGGRLATEEEWEWIAREGGAVRFTSVERRNHPLTAKTAGSAPNHGPNAFGVTDLLRPEFVGETAKLGRFGHIWFQDDSEVVGLHAAYRSSLAGEDAGYRLVRDDPKAKAPATVHLNLAATMQRTLVALRSKDPGAAIRTVETLLAMPIEDDTRLLLSRLAPLVAKMKMGKDELLQVFSDAAARPKIKAELIKAKLPTVEAKPAIQKSASAALAGPMWATSGFTVQRRNATPARGPRGKVKVLWSQKLGKNVTGAVIGGDGTIYVGDDTGRVHAVSPAGKKLWSHKATGAILSTPAIDAGGTIWVGRAGTKLIGYPPNGDVDAATVISIGSAHTAPAIAPDGTQYVQTKSGPLLAIRDSKIVWRYAMEKWVTPPRRVPTLGADGTIYFLASTLCAVTSAGKKRLSLPMMEKHGSVRTDPVIAEDGSIIVGFSDVGVAWLAADGKLVRSVKLPDNVNPEVLAIDSKGNVYVSSNTAAACVFVYSPSGKKLRELQANNWIHGAVTLDADDTAYFGSLMNLYAYDTRGKMLWHAPAKGRTTSPVIASDGTLYITTDQGYLQAYRS